MGKKFFANLLLIREKNKGGPFILLEGSSPRGKFWGRFFLGGLIPPQKRNSGGKKWGEIWKKKVGGRPIIVNPPRRRV